MKLEGVTTFLWKRVRPLLSPLINLYRQQRNGCSNVWRFHYWPVCGNTVLVDDGLIGMEVTAIEGTKLSVKCWTTATWVKTKVWTAWRFHCPASTGWKRQTGPDFGCEQGVDFVAASFIRKRSELSKSVSTWKRTAAKTSTSSQNRKPGRPQQLRRNPRSLWRIMVARGDLGVEIPVEEVIFARRWWSKNVSVHVKSLSLRPNAGFHDQKPTPDSRRSRWRCNAILDGTDAVMLSGESAKGNTRWKRFLSWRPSANVPTAW